jgi:hypothetical protein
LNLSKLASASFVVFGLRRSYGQGMFFGVRTSRYEVTKRTAIATAIWSACAGCGSSRPAPASSVTAGDVADDNHGQLAKASVKFTTDLVLPSLNSDEIRRRAARWLLADNEIGGNTYGNYEPEVPPDPPLPTHPYSIVESAPHGTIVGRVLWSSALPSWVQLPCGEIYQPVRIGALNSVGGAIVSIEDPSSVLTGALQAALIRDVRVNKVACTIQPRMSVVFEAAHVHIENDGTPTTFAVSGQPDTKVPAFGAAAIDAGSGTTTIAAVDTAPAFVRVLNNPLFSMTDDTGTFVIDDVVAGSYQLRVWHPPLLSKVAGKLHWSQPLQTLRPVTVRPGQVTRLTLRIGSTKAN